LYRLRHLWVLAALLVAALIVATIEPARASAMSALALFKGDPAPIAAAIGTLVIAFLTLRNVGIAKRTLQVQERPLLVDVPPSAPRPADMPFELRDGKEDFYLNFGDKLPKAWIDPRRACTFEEDGGVFISFPLRNVGRGLAQIEKVKLRGSSRLQDNLNAPPGCTRYFVIRKRQVPAGETVRIDIVVKNKKERPALKEPVSVDVKYFDTSRSQERWVSVQLLSPRDGESECRYVRILNHKPPTG
jgi:hypothetical protein